MTVGSMGSEATCAIQGFLIMVFYMAFPFYYASISVCAYLAVKSNFDEEKYAWIEKWIHLGAYALPLSLAIASLAKGWYGPGLAFCILSPNVSCDNYVECFGDDNNAFDIHTPLEYLILVELLVGTGTITVLLCKYEQMQRDIDEAVGYTRIVETARRRRLVEVAIQTGLYLFTFWFGYLPAIVESFVRYVADVLMYNLIIASHCIFAFQGALLLAIYLALSRINRRAPDARLTGATVASNETTVSKIRANAERRRRMSAISSVSNRSAFSFSIFDGTPAADSPWAQYLGDSEGFGEVSETSTTSDLTSDLATRLISDGMIDQEEDYTAE